MSQLCWKLSSIQSTLIIINRKDVRFPEVGYLRKHILQTYINRYSQKESRQQLKCCLLLVLYVKIIKSTFIWHKCISRCVLVLALNTFTSQFLFHSSFPASTELATVQHCIQEREWRGICMCWGWRSTKESNKETGWRVGFEHCVVRAFGSHSSICPLPLFSWVTVNMF